MKAATASSCRNSIPPISSQLRARPLFTLALRTLLRQSVRPLVSIATAPATRPLRFAMAPKQATLGYVKPTQRTIGCV